MSTNSDRMMDDPVVLISLALFVAGAIYYVGVMLPRHWSGKSKDRDEYIWSWMPYSKDVKLATRRVLPTLAAGIVAMSCTGILVLVSEIVGYESDGVGVFKVLLALGAAGSVGWLPIGYFVLYRNIPKFMVAPHYRNDKGLVEIYRERGELKKRRIKALVEFLIVVAIVAGIVWLVVATG